MLVISWEWGKKNILERGHLENKRGQADAVRIAPSVLNIKQAFPLYIVRPVCNYWS